MYTVIETPTFQRLWPHYWTEQERGEFAAYIAQQPEAGEVVRDSGGVRRILVPGLEISVYDAAVRPVSAVAQQWKGFRMQDRFDGKIDIEIRPMEMMG